MQRTWRAVWVVLREGHPGLEVAAVVEGVGVEHDQSDAPFEDVVVDKLLCVSRRFSRVALPHGPSTSGLRLSHLDVGPSLFAECFKLVHKQAFRAHLARCLDVQALFASIM